MIQRATPWAPTLLCTPNDPSRTTISLHFPPVIIGAAYTELSPCGLTAGYLQAELTGRKPNRTKERGSIYPVAGNLWSSRIKKIITVTFNNHLFLFFPAINFSLFHLWVWQCSACGPFLWLIPGAGFIWASLQAWNNAIKKRRGEKENRGNRALTYSKSHLNIQIGTETLLSKYLLFPCYTIYTVFLVIVCSKISWAWY